MTARYFVDTRAWQSLLVASDQHHAKVVDAYSEAHRDGGIFVTSSLVLGELFTLMSSRANAAATFWTFRDGLRASARIKVLDISAQHVEASFDLLRHRPDKAYSFVDATSFVLMRDESILAAFTLDRHFAQECFQMAPGTGELMHESGSQYSADTDAVPSRGIALPTR